MSSTTPPVALLNTTITKYAKFSTIIKGHILKAILGNFCPLLDKFIFMESSQLAINVQLGVLHIIEFGIRSPTTDREILLQKITMT